MSLEWTDKDEIEYQGCIRLIEGIILRVLDDISISGKWYNRDLSLNILKKKRTILRQMLKWFRHQNWDILLDIYCNYIGINKKNIKKKFERIRKESVRYTNIRIKEKNKNTTRTDRNTVKVKFTKTEENI